MKSQKRSKKRSLRFFNRPIKLGVGIAGLGASIELGKSDIYTLIDDPKLIFWLEVLKYTSYIIGFLFASGGVFTQAKEDLSSIKLGEKAKDIAEKVINVEEDPKENVVTAAIEKDKGLSDLFGTAIDLVKRRRSKKQKK